MAADNPEASDNDGEDAEEHHAAIFARLQSDQQHVGIITKEFFEGFTTETDSYVFHELLGDGGVGSVFRCTVEKDGKAESVAVKVIDTQRIALMCSLPFETVFWRLLNEVEIMRILQGHEHIIKLYSAYASQTLRLYLVMELVQGGDLFSEIVRRRRPFNEVEARTVIQQLLLAICHCHDKGIAHRDIKLGNVVIASSDPLVVKLADYGQARAFDINGSTVSDASRTLTTAPLYTPPEVVDAVKANCPYDAFKVDSFGFGVLLYGLLCSALPDVRGGDYEAHHYWKRISVAAQDLIRKLLDADPTKRMSVREIGSHLWMDPDCAESIPPARRSVARASADPCQGIINGKFMADLECEIEALLAIQGLQWSMQQERGVSCMFLTSDDGLRDHTFRCKRTDDGRADAERFLEKVMGVTKQEGVWEGAREVVESVRVETGELRRVFSSAKAAVAGEDEAKELLECIFAGYCSIIGRVGSALINVLFQLKGGDVPGQREMRLRLLLLASEQLGRERGFMCGLMGNSQLSIQSPWARIRLAKMQAARQVLVGSSTATKGSDLAICGEGIMRNLGLMERAPLSSSDVTALEQAEINACRGETDAAEFFATITSLIDKVHRLVSIGIVELLTTPHTSNQSPNSFSNSPQPSM
eukprot:TRINITY_DN43634_c0_g1_i1.p1 TRINITY_DN43634_c0_g1~~TRINITY_DN43634_c0_g1_i1.p1  ORF type:complete len:676 (-),score=101.21 TRINITY_DN43634_c0_g1_i1:128-2062(-)